jgi:hypothetical protein
MVTRNNDDDLERLHDLFIMPRSGLCQLGFADDTTSGESRVSLTALRYGAIDGIVRDVESVLERYHREYGPCWNFDHRSVTQGTLVRFSNV